MNQTTRGDVVRGRKPGTENDGYYLILCRETYYEDGEKKCLDTAAFAAHMNHRWICDFPDEIIVFDPDSNVMEWESDDGQMESIEIASIREVSHELLEYPEMYA